MKFNKENLDATLELVVNSMKVLVIAINHFKVAETQEEAWEIEDKEVLPALNIFNDHYTRLANLLEGHSIDELGLDPINELMLTKLLEELMQKANEISDILIKLSE